MRQSKLVSFEGLVGEVFGFYGVDGNCFKLGKNVFEAIEDPGDGYRSYLDEVRTVSREEQEQRKLTFFRRPIATVEVVESSVINGHNLVDRDSANGYIWLTIGTDHSDDWYPQCVFQYNPKEK